MQPRLTPQGYLATTVDEEVADLGSKVLANVSPTLNLDPAQPLGKVLGIFAEKFASLTADIAEIYAALDPDNATGQLLKNASAVTGTYPQVATYSIVTLDMVLNAGASVAPGATAFVTGQPGNLWVLTGPPGNPGANVQNTGSGQVTLQGLFRSINPGPQLATAGTIQQIGTPTTGWVSVNNPADALQGLTADTDDTLRTKRAEELQGQGSGDLPSIRAAVLKVGGIEPGGVFVLENNTPWSGVTVGAFTYSVAPKSFRVVVWDGPTKAASNDAIAQAIWDAKPAGISADGSTGTYGTATDSLGNTRVIPFDRCTQNPVYIAVTTASALTSAQVTAVKSALAAFAQANWTLGATVVQNELYGVVYGAIGSFGNKVTSLYIGLAPSPTGTADLPMSQMQIATLSTGNVTVNGS